MLGAARCKWFVVFCLCAAFTGAAQANDKFGVVGSSPEFSWWRSYNADYDNINLPGLDNKGRLWVVGKIDDNPQNEEAYGAGAVSAFPWMIDKDAQRAGYMRVFEREKVGVKKIIDECLKDPKMAEIHFAIGNEPNAFPYIDPEVYAEVFHAYRNYIKRDLNCQKCIVHNGGILAADLWVIRDPLSAENATQELWSFLLAPTMKGLTWLAGGDVDMVGYGPGKIRLANYANYTRFFLQKLAAIGGSVDVFNVHLYRLNMSESSSGISLAGVAYGLGKLTSSFSPYDLVVWRIDPKSNYQTFLATVRGKGVTTKRIVDICGENGYVPGGYACNQDGTGIYDPVLGRVRFCINGTELRLDNGKRCTPNESFALVGRMLESKNSYATNLSYRYDNPEIWVDELGVITPTSSRETVAAEMKDIVSYLNSQQHVQKWFWYKDVGWDKKYQIESLSPKIDLYEDYSYAQRTSLGNVYYGLASGSISPRQMIGAEARLPAMNWGVTFNNLVPLDAGKSSYVIDFRKDNSSLITNATAKGTGYNGSAFKWLYSSDRIPAPDATLTVRVPESCNDRVTCLEIHDANFMAIELGEDVGAPYVYEKFVFRLKNKKLGTQRIVQYVPGYTTALTDGYVAGSSTDARLNVDLRKIKTPEEIITSIEVNLTPQLTAGIAPKTMDYEAVIGRIMFSASDISLLFGCLPMDPTVRTVYAGRNNLALDLSGSRKNNRLSVLGGTTSLLGVTWDDKANRLSWTPAKSQLGRQLVRIGRGMNYREYTFDVVEPKPTSILVAPKNGASESTQLSLDAGVGAQTFSLKVNGEERQEGVFDAYGKVNVSLEKKWLTKCQNRVEVSTCDASWGCRNDETVVKNLGVCTLPSIMSLLE